MIFRKATEADIDRIEEIYDEIHNGEESGNMSVGWIRGVYPVRQTAIDAVKLGTMYVCEDDGVIVSAAKLDHEQVAEYADASWEFDAPDDKVMVMHTLVVSPSLAKKGYGKAFVAFYEKHALSEGCPYLRIDTNEKNSAARSLYKKLGFNEVGIVDCEFNGIPGVHLVCLEKCLL